MGDNNLRWVRIGGILCIIVVLFVGVIKLTQKNNIDSSYKPMVKVNNAIYLWLDLKDVNFSSNVCSKGDEIYKYDDTRIVVVSEKTKSIFRKNDQ